MPQPPRLRSAVALAAVLAAAYPAASTWTSAPAASSAARSVSFLPGNGGLSAQAATDLPRTWAERTSWTEITPHEEVISFYRSLAARSPEIRMRTIGQSIEGRPIHLVVLARPAIAEPWEAHASGKPVVFIGAQVHGDEPGGKEGLMLFARDLALDSLTHLLDDVVFVFVPQINPDGAEAGEWGTRNNVAGDNVNRDYMRLEHPETRAMVTGALVPWRPHLLVDAHELVGPPRIYDFYTRNGQSVNGPWATTRFGAERIVPAVVGALDREGYTHFTYHRVPGGLADDPEQGLSPGAYGARALSHYGAPHGAVSILFESLRPRDAREDLERRAHKHHVAMTGLARAAAEHADELVAAVAEGRMEVRSRGLALDEADSIAVDVSEAASRREPYRFQSGGEIVEVVAPILDSLAVEEARVRPLGYAIEPHREDIARHLMTHGLHVERLTAPARVAAESFRVGGEGPDAPTLEPGTVELEAGTFVVRTAQPTAAIAIHLLEPEDGNSLADAGYFDETAAGDTLPVHRLLELPDVGLEGVVSGDAVR